MAMKLWQQQRQSRTVKYSPSSEIKVFVGKANTHSKRVKSTEKEKAAETRKCHGQRGRQSPRQANIIESKRKNHKTEGQSSCD